jgi:hypothetical protein
MISIPDAALAALAATGAWGNHGEDLGDCSKCGWDFEIEIGIEKNRIGV